MRVKRFVEDTFISKHPRTVKELFKSVCEKKNSWERSITEEEFIQAVESLKAEGRIDLEIYLPEVKSYFDYLRKKSEKPASSAAAASVVRKS